MSITRSEALQDIAEAVSFTEQITAKELFQLLDINEGMAIEVVLKKLFNAPINPRLNSLPREKKLAAIHTCEVIIGKLFLLSTGFVNITQ